MLKVREVVTEPGYVTLLQAVDEVSIALFGVTLEDTLWTEQAADQDSDAWDAYEGNFDNVDEPYDETEPFWRAIGWDISDGRGDELPSAVWFGRQIVAAEGKLVPGALFTPDGSGKRQLTGSQEHHLSNDQLEKNIEAMVESWMKGR